MQRPTPSPESANVPIPAPAKSNRERPIGERRFTFKIPETCRSLGDPTSVTLRELDSDGIDAAAAIAPSARVMKTVSTKMAITAVDGAEVRNDEGQLDVMWNGWSSKVRGLIYVGFDRIHSSNDAEDDAFLSSMAAE